MGFGYGGGGCDPVGGINDNSFTLFLILILLLLAFMSCPRPHHPC